MVVVFELVSHRKDGDGRRVLDLEQRHVAGAAERYQQLAKERAGAGFAVDKRSAAEPVGRIDDRGKRLLGELQVFHAGAAIEQVFIEAFQIVTRRRAVTDGEGHPRTRFDAFASIFPSSAWTAFAVT